MLGISRGKFTVPVFRGNAGQEQQLLSVRQPSLVHTSNQQFLRGNSTDLREDDPHNQARLYKPSLSVDGIAAQIDRQGRRWKDQNSDNLLTLSYTFRNLAQDESRFNDVQKNQARRAMQSWADVANISFQEDRSRSEGMLSFVNSEGPKIADAQYPGGRGRVRINPEFNNNLNPTVNSFERHTLTHEIGHALGASHSGDYVPPIEKLNYKNHATYAQDSRAYTVMSYFDPSNTGQDFKDKQASSPLMADIAWAQKVYGANYKTRNADTTYGFNSNTNRDDLTLKSSADSAVFCVWDGGGTDTLDFSGFHQDQIINLRAQSFSDVGGLKGNVSIAKGVTLENAIGGSGHDVIIGNEANNVLKGGAGADRLRGAAGADTFAYDNLNDSTWWDADQIMDFVSGTDKIDLSEMLSKEGIGALKFVQRLSGRRGEAILNYDRQTNESKLYIDTAGRGTFDFFLKSNGQINRSDIIVGPSLAHPAQTHTDPVMDSVSDKNKIDISAALGKVGIDALTFVERMSRRRGDAMLTYDQRANQSHLYIDTTGNGYRNLTYTFPGKINQSDIIVAPAGTQRYA